MWLRYFDKGKIREVSEVTRAELDRILAGEPLSSFFSLIASKTSYIRASVDAAAKTGPKANPQKSVHQPWTLEYFDGQSRQFFRSFDRITLEQVRQAFCSYVVGSDEWHHIVHWQRMRQEAEIPGREGGMRALFTWWGIECARTMPLMEVTLEFQERIHATAIVESPEIANPLLWFLGEIAELPEPWTGERRFHSSNEKLRINCGRCNGGVIYLDVALDADCGTAYGHQTSGVAGHYPGVSRVLRHGRGSGVTAERTAEADRGRHPGFPIFNVRRRGRQLSRALAGSPASSSTPARGSDEKPAELRDQTQTQRFVQDCLRLVAAYCRPIP
jgi:hypothetical protein